MLGLAREVGFNLTAVAEGEAVRAAMRGGDRDDEVACAIVLATGGDGFFERFRAAGHAAAGHAGETGHAGEEHPLDLYTERVTLALCDAVEAQLGVRARAVFAHGETRVDFQTLGVACGVGQRSALGILLHPEYGPWVSLRAALLLPVALTPSGAPIAGAVACETCARPCVAACPVRAPMHPPEQPGFAFEACFASVALTTRCDTACHARAACPVGARHRYGAAQHEFHHRSFVKMVRALRG